MSVSNLTVNLTLKFSITFSLSLQLKNDPFIVGAMRPIEIIRNHSIELSADNSFENCIRHMTLCVKSILNIDDIYVLERLTDIEFLSKFSTEHFTIERSKLDDDFSFSRSVMNVLFEFNTKNRFVRSTEVGLMYQDEPDRKMQEFGFVSFFSGKSSRKILLLGCGDIPEISVEIDESLTLFLNQVCAELQIHLVEQQALSDTYRHEQRLATLIEKNRHVDHYVRYLERLHLCAIQLAASPSLDDLYRGAVYNARVQFGLDRVALFLVDVKRNIQTGTYGIDLNGEVEDKYSYNSEIPNLDYIKKAFAHPGELQIIESAPLYENKEVVGLGWHALVALADENNTVFAMITTDNLLTRQELDPDQIKVIEKYSLYLSEQIYRKRQAEDVRILHQTLNELSNAKTKLEICRLAVDLAREHLNIDRLALFLLDESKIHMIGTYGTDEEGNTSDETDFKSVVPETPFIHDAITTKDYFYLKNNVPLYHEKEIVGYGWNAIIALWSDTEAIGWIAADNLINHQPMTSHHEKIIKSYASSVAQLIAKKQLQEKFEQYSITDELTKLSNRRFFDQEYQKVCDSELTDIAILMIDIDNFKALNDHSGHDYGDECLIRVASCIERAMKHADDVVARYGGEEFIVMLPNATENRASKVAKLIHENLASAQIHHPDSKVGAYITCSIGMALSNINTLIEPKILLINSDNALYQAKAEGKNRTCLFSEK